MAQAACKRSATTGGNDAHAQAFSWRISGLRARRPCPRARLSRQADPPDRALGAGRADRHSGAAPVANPAQARPARDRREPPRRGRRDRRARGRDRRARRPDLADRQHQRARGHPGRVGERRLRSGEELRAGREDFRELPDPRGAPVRAVEERERIRRRREGQSGQVQLLAHRRGRPAASDRRAVQVEHRHRSGRRALQERRRSADRGARPTGALHLRGDLDPAAADPRRQGARARHHQPHPHAARAATFRP